MEFNDGWPPSLPLTWLDTRGLWKKTRDGTVAAWTAAREGVIDPTVSAHSGRIVKLTGDGFLVEFPTVQQAVACAIDMQEKMADSPLKFRMGVNLGDIIDDGRDIHGEGVNIAARLEALADEGGICVSGLVYESIRNRIEASFEDLGENAVKHVSAPVRVYRIGVGDGVEGKVSPLAESMTSVLERPAVAVLPFDNMSGDADQDYFADGLTEDIITELSKYGWFPVIANPTFVFRASPSTSRKSVKSWALAMWWREVCARLAAVYALPPNLSTRPRVTTYGRSDTTANLRTFSRYKTKSRCN